MMISRILIFNLCLVLLVNSISKAQSTDDNDLSTSALKKFSLEELMNIDITIVSKQPQQWFEVPAAVNIISNNEINRSGATNLADALRLAAGLRVAQVNSNAWIVTARGFSYIYANKLLVMIDGRTVYTPLFAGVFWDAQNVLLEDIKQIEIISGPGGTLWGANAVNGIINIKTKNAGDTQGLYVSGAAGSFIRDWASLRYGGSLGSNLFFRINVQRFDRDHTFARDGQDNPDKWGITQGGFRIDYYPSDENTFTFQGDYYSGLKHTIPENSTMDGQNLLGRWTHTFSPESNFKLQLYIDRTWRHENPSTVSDQLVTYDVDFQHNFLSNTNHNILWGAGFRVMQDETSFNTLNVGFIPNNRTMKLFSGFIQDEIKLIADALKLTIGTKLEHNDFSGFEIQPSVRLAYIPSDNQVIWGAVTRAVRSPSRIDVDYHIPAYEVPPGSPNVDGGPNFGAEKLIAYELGYRLQPVTQLSFSIASFYNSYDDIFSVDPLPGTVTYQIQNGTRGQSWGAELSVNYQLSDWWFIRFGYTYFHKDLWKKPGHTSDPAPLGNDPENQVVLHSILDLSEHFQFDVVAHYVDSLPNPHVPSYFTLDARLAWQYNNFEISLTGQNLNDNRHQEFGSVEIPRNLYGKVSFSM